MGLRLNLKLENKHKVQQTIFDVANNVKDARPIWNAIAEDFGATNRQQFSSQGKGSWAPLSSKYAAQKAKRYPGQKILHRTGKLERDLTQQPFGIDVRNRKMMILGTAERTGRWHQDGTEKMPQRKIFDFTSYRINKWSKIISSHIINGKKR